MSNLTSMEEIKIERLLSMELGYVLDFSNSTFRAFLLENFEIEIYSNKFGFNGNSKANRLRALWKLESNQLVGNLILSLIDYGLAKSLYSNDTVVQRLIDDCAIISKRLLQDSPVENIDAIQAGNEDKDFNLLAKSIRESIQKNEPEGALDRLHTFVIKYIRDLCGRHSIPFNKDTALHTLFGGYLKYLDNESKIDSEMTKRILKSSISVMEAFNDVRNNKSFAHDNPILNYNESILIFNNISNIIKFIDSIERPIKKNDIIIKDEIDFDNIDLPF